MWEGGAIRISKGAFISYPRYRNKVPVNGQDSCETLPTHTKAYMKTFCNLILKLMRKVAKRHLHYLLIVLDYNVMKREWASHYCQMYAGVTNCVNNLHRW